MTYFDLLVENENEIVFGEYKRSLIERIIGLLNDAGLSQVEINDIETEEDMSYWMSAEADVLIRGVPNNNAVFLYYRGLDEEVSTKLIGRCPRCMSAELEERFYYGLLSGESQSKIERGEASYLSAAYDRHGVPAPNWICRKCGLSWYDKESLLRSIGK